MAKYPSPRDDTVRLIKRRGDNVKRNAKSEGRKKKA